MEKLIYSNNAVSIKRRSQGRERDVNNLLKLMRKFDKEAGDGLILPKDNAWLVESLRGINDELLKHL